MPIFTNIQKFEEFYPTKVSQREYRQFSSIIDRTFFILTLFHISFVESNVSRDFLLSVKVWKKEKKERHEILRMNTNKKGIGHK